MSNPGVITLASLRNAGSNIKRLDIEDNIGEAIHIHLNSLRLDLSVNEFIALADQLFQSAYSLNVFQKFELDKLDPHFLLEISHLIKDIKKIEIQHRRLADLQCLVRLNVPKIGYVMTPKRIEDSPAYRYLKSGDKSFEHYVQHNYPGLDNVTRLEQLHESVKENGYSHRSSFIVLFGDQKVIRDGQHRAAIIAADCGLEQVVPVMVMHFRGNRWKSNFYLHFFGVALRKIGAYGWRRGVAVLQRFQFLINKLLSLVKL